MIMVAGSLCSLSLYLTFSVTVTSTYPDSHISLLNEQDISAYDIIINT